MRHALGSLSALVLLADGTGSGQLQASRGVGQDTGTERSAPRGDLDCGASPLDAIVGAVVPAPGHRFEKAGPGEHAFSSRGRSSGWDWTASRLEAEVHAIVRQLGPSAWRGRNGRIADRPVLFTFPARGPPATA